MQVIAQVSTSSFQLEKKTLMAAGQRHGPPK